jgi:lantibiotic modifying enzyme
MPVLTGDLETEALAAVEAIASTLLQPDSVDVHRFSLSSGSAGVALFFSYLSFARPDDGNRHADRAVQLLSRSVDALATQSQVPSLYGGFTGIAWAVEHLQGRLFDTEGEDANSGIDEALGDYLAQSPWRLDYDLVSGLVGFGLYALERNNRTILEKIVDRLSETAIEKPEGLTWFTPPHLLIQWQRETYPSGYYNLGLAHGVPGVIALLGEICARDIAPRKARPLLDGAVRWLMSQKQTGEGDSYFAHVVREDGVEPGPQSSRLAWCYGDLGIAAALLWAARSTGEAEWEAEALEIARRAARRPFEQSGVFDAGLCHGAAGNAHIFNRLYQATREPLFLDAARHWFERTLAYRRPGEGVGGFFAWRPTDSRWEAEPGWLEGAAGIGLALLSATGKLPADWDRPLMVSIPPA